MPILYTETNFFQSIATGRSPDAEKILELETPGLHRVMPAICFFEAFKWMEEEVKRQGRVREELGRQIGEASRDLTSPHARQLRSHLTNASIARERLLDDVDRRLFMVVRRLSAICEMPGLSPTVLDLARREPLIEQLSDNLILHVILDHARNASDPAKALLTENHTDFGTTEVKKALREVSVKYFSGVNPLLAWLRAQSLPGSS